jgi:hypothetical protein
VIPQPQSSWLVVSHKLDGLERRGTVSLRPMRFFASLAVGFVALFILSIGAQRIAGPPTCRDGTYSASIGTQGACSWHGGVDRGGDVLSLFAFVLSGAAGLAFHSSALGERLDRPRKRSQSPRYVLPSAPTGTEAPRPQRAPRHPRPIVPPREGELACPECGNSMRKRKAKRGRYRGRQFWGCGRYPDCSGLRNIH